MISAVVIGTNLGRVNPDPILRRLRLQARQRTTPKNHNSPLENHELL